MGQRLCCRCCVPNIDLGHFPPRVARPLTAGAWLPWVAIVGEEAATCGICPLLRTFGPKRRAQGGLDSEADVDEAAKGKTGKQTPHFQQLHSQQVRWWGGAGRGRSSDLEPGGRHLMGEAAVAARYLLAMSSGHLGPPPAASHQTGPSCGDPEQRTLLWGGCRRRNVTSNPASAHPCPSIRLTPQGRGYMPLMSLSPHHTRVIPTSVSILPASTPPIYLCIYVSIYLTQKHRFGQMP